MLLLTGLRISEAQTSNPAGHEQESSRGCLSIEHFPAGHVLDMMRNGENWETGQARFSGWNKPGGRRHVM